MWKRFCARSTINFTIWGFVAKVASRRAVRRQPRARLLIYHRSGPTAHPPRPPRLYARTHRAWKLSDTVYALESTTI